MSTKFAFPWPKRLRIFTWLTALAAGTAAAVAQAPSPRIQSEINGSDVVPLRGVQHAYAQPQFDAGRMPSNTKLSGISIVFNRTAAQQADLDALISAQQDPSSPLYHQWLTPEQFASRFGMAQADIDKVQSWLQQQGFAVDSTARSRNQIRFSGTVSQVEQAFRTEMHYYKIGGAQHFAASTVLSVPAAIAPTIESVRNLTDFRPKAMQTPGISVKPHPNFTSSVSGGVFFAPGDITTVYDIAPLYSGGINGAGQSIAVVGQSAIVLSDIENFQAAAGLAKKDPTLVLIPGSGSSTLVSGDQSESDLDIQWSGAIAPGANIFFVYSGNNMNFSAFDAIAYAVDERLASIISISYGVCETALNGFSLESTLQQAAAQGQTVIAASGDQGSTACSGDTTNGLTQAQQFAEAVNYPASSQYVTGTGGTAITQADSSSSNSTYWIAQGSSDVINSAKTYIPEIAWNDNSTTAGLSASGGGPSALYAKPAWQKGVPGIPADGKRDVPDVALYSSPAFPGYLYCTSDQTAWNTTTPPLQQASCNSGFRDAASQDLTIAGGTSFASPIFAGIVALMNQKAGYVSGQGLINPTLYTLASNGSTYASAFHDVTSGNNNCNAGPKFCGSTTGGFSAGTGYDQVTGLGSVDVANLAAAWPMSTSTLIGTSTAIVAANGTPNVNTNVVFTITVMSASGSSVPGGTVTLDIDGGTPGGGTTVSNLPLTASGTYSYTAQFSTAGSHQIVAKYSGDAMHAPSTGIVLITVPGTGPGAGTFGIAGTNVTVAQGNSATSTITLTPKNGYTGTIYLTFTTSNDAALTNLCYNFTTLLNNGDGSVTVSNANPVTTTMTFDTNASHCATGASVKNSGFRALRRVGTVKTSRSSCPNPAPLGMALAGVLLAGFLGRSSRKLRGLASVIVLGSIGLGIAACGGSVTMNNTATNPPKGSYTISLTGTDSVTSTITAQTTFTLVIN